MPNYAAQAAMKCKEPLFTQFLYQCEHHAGRTPDSADQALRNLAKVDSRSDFNMPDGFEKWFRVLKLFGKWRQGFGTDDHGDPVPPFIMGQEAFDRGCEMRDNPFSEDHKDGKDWRQGWKTKNWRDEFTRKGRG